MITRLTRSDLYARIWARPATKVAAEIGISDVGLLKICERHGIPKPPRGYWAKVAVGKTFERPPLPPAESAGLEQVSIAIERANGKSNAIPVVPLTVPVATRLSSPHPIVEATMLTLKSRDQSREGLVFAAGPTAIRVSVTPKNINRAMLVLDAFVKVMESEGFALQPRNRSEHADIVMHRRGSDYPLKLREHLQRTDLPLTPKQVEEIRKWGHCFGDRYKHTPDGRLIFTFGEDYDPISIQDTANTRLENKLGHLVSRILGRIRERDEKARRYAEESAAREVLLAEQRKREAEVERLKKEEQNRIAKLNNQIANWKLSRDIRQYISETRQLVQSHDAKITPGGPIDNWLSWAENYASKIDPLSALKAELQKVQADRQNKSSTTATAPPPQTS